MNLDTTGMTIPGVIVTALEQLNEPAAGIVLDWLQEQPAITIQGELRRVLLHRLGE